MSFVPFHRRPAIRTILGIALWAAAYIVVFRAADPESASLALTLDAGLLGAAAVVTLILMSQFVLPVKTWDERLAVLARLLDYAIGVRGPVLFLREGKTIAAKGEQSRQGRGVLLADYTSAGVLRTQTRYTRAIGPGVSFTQAGERLADSLDLRRQTRRIHGLSPTAEVLKDKGGTDSLALTEDGISVSAEIKVTFMLDPGHRSPPREGQFPHLPPYEFNPRAAERAVYGHAHREDAPTEWSDLPLLIAADVWREEVKRWPLQALITSVGDGPSALDQIERAMKSRLIGSTSAGDGEKGAEASHEMDVLRRRGVRILDIEIGYLQVPEEVRQEHLRRWREGWGSALEEGVLEARGRGQEARWSGEREGQFTFIMQVTRSLSKELAGGRRPEQRDSLIQLVSDGIESLQDPEMLSDSGALVDHLQQLNAELRDLDNDCRGPGS
jgi:hypothetical protein